MSENMENNERTRTRQDAQELTAQLSKLCTLDTETQQAWIKPYLLHLAALATPTDYILPGAVRENDGADCPTYEGKP